MKAEKRTRKQYDEAFKRDAVALVLDQGHKVTNAGPAACVSPNLIYRWKLEFRIKGSGAILSFGKNKSSWATPNPATFGWTS